MMLAPLVVGVAALTATDQLIIAIAAVLIAVSNAIPVAMQVWAIIEQRKTAKATAGKLDTIDANTNGAIHAVRAELVEVKKQLAVQRDTSPPAPPRVVQ